MACLLPTGITTQDDDCNGSFGGLLKVYLANQSQVSSVRKNASTDVITGITMSNGGKFYGFEFDDVVGSGLEEEVQGDAGGFVKQTLSMTLRKISQEKKQVLSRLKRAKLMAIVQESDGTYKLAGETGKGLQVAGGGALTISRGVAPTDQGGSTVSLIANTLDFADEVSSSVIASIIA